MEPWRGNQLNDFPQPQVLVAFGFLISNPLPCSPSSKSITDPDKYAKLAGSRIKGTPSLSRIASSGLVSSNDIPYWNPEQPPDSTKTRSFFAGELSSDCIVLILSAARGESVIMQGT
jgi:hypothetical protein